MEEGGMAPRSNHNVPAAYPLTPPASPPISFTTTSTASVRVASTVTWGTAARRWASWDMGGMWWSARGLVGVMRSGVTGSVVSSMWRAVTQMMADFERESTSRGEVRRVVVAVIRGGREGTIPWEIGSSGGVEGRVLRRVLRAVRVGLRRVGVVT